MRFAAWSFLPFEIIQWPVPSIVAVIAVLGYRLLWAPPRPMPMRAAEHHRRRFA